jgi:DNA-binding CsgD family transcriptional regulator
MADFNLAMYEVRLTPNYKYARRRLKNLPLKDKLRVYGKVFYPHRLVLDDKEAINVLCKIPDIFEELEDTLTYRQLEVMKMMSYGCTHQEICDEIGYTNRSSITSVINDVRRIILEMVADTRTDNDIEDEIIKLTEESDDCPKTTRGDRRRKTNGAGKQTSVA